MGRRIRATVVAVLVVAAVGAAPARPAPSAPPPAPPPGVDPDSLLVRLAPRGAGALDERGLRSRRPIGATGYLEVAVPAAGLAATRAALAGDRRVLAVQYNHLFRALATPNDPGLPGQAGLARIRAPEAWERQATPGPGAGQLIAVVDSGVDLDHPDLDGQLVPGYDFVDDNDGDGRDDDPTMLGDPQPDDEHGHGTAVAGVAAAEANNGAGGAGVAHAAKVLPVRVLNRRAGGTEADIAEGIDFATLAGADVINLSLGGPGSGGVLQSAVERAVAAGAVVVAASGNYGSPVPMYPAAYPGVLAVGGSDDTGAVTWFSEFGPWVDLVAPATAVYTTVLGGGFGAATGTSFSAPFAAGAAAMVRTANPAMTPAAVIERLGATAQDAAAAGPDPYYGAGVLDVLAALVPTERQAALPPGPGDPHETGAPTVLPAPAASLSTATISPEGDVDEFTFDVPGRGTLFVSVTPGDSPSSYQWLDPVLRVGREGEAAREVDTFGPLAPEFVVLRDVEPGRYRVAVRNHNASRTAPYTIEASFHPPPPPEPPPTTTEPPPPAPPPAPLPPRSGYWMLDASGRVYPFGDAGWFGDGGPRAVDIEPTPSGDGYWIVDQGSSIYPRGDAPYLGGTRILEPGESVTSISRTASGQGAWLFTNRGRVITYGDARHFGDMAGTQLNGPVLDSVPTPTGNGYFMVASDGGVFAFGDAVFAGSMGDTRLNQPVQSLVPDADNRGYWLVAADGGIFAFDAGFFGSMGDTRLNKPITGMVRSATGNGYLMVAEDGGIFAFGDARFHGSLGDTPPAAAITSVAYLGA